MHPSSDESGESARMDIHVCILSTTSRSFACFVPSRTLLVVYSGSSYRLILPLFYVLYSEAPNPGRRRFDFWTFSADMHRGTSAVVLKCKDD